MRFGSASRVFATVVLALLFTLGAKADTIQFTFTPGPDANTGLGFSFAIDSTAPSIPLFDDGFLYGNVLITLSNGFQYTSLVLFENTASLLNPQGFDLTIQEPLVPGVNIDYAGHTLFTGTTSPVFTPGTFSLTGTSTPDGTLTISTVAPEPSSFLFLGTGAFVFAGTIRRRLS